MLVAQEVFERMLAEEGVVLAKLWFHLSKAQQAARFEALAGDKRTRWRVTPTDWEHHARYDRFRRVCERALGDDADRRWRTYAASAESGPDGGPPDRTARHTDG